MVGKMPRTKASAPAGAASAGWNADELKAAVGLDLSQVMQGAATGAQARRAPINPPSRPPRRIRASWIGGGLAAGFCGLAIGLILIGPRQPAPVAEPLPRVATLTVIPVPVAEELPPVPAAEDLLPAPVMMPARSAVLPAARPAAPVLAQPPAPKVVDAVARAPEAPPPRAFAFEPRVAVAEDPVPAYQPATRRDVMAADRNLRRAWNEAAASGAPRGLLIEYRRRWTWLNSQLSDDPDRLVSEYRDMADELDRGSNFSEDAVG